MDLSKHVKFTKQQTFDMMIAGLAKQVWRRATTVFSSGAGSCRYLTPEGLRCAAGQPERANARVFIDGDGKVHHYGTFTGFIVVYGMAKFGRGWIIFDKFKSELTSSDLERDRHIERTPFDIMSELDDKELELGEAFAMKRDRVTPDWAKAMKRDKR